jgi:hypothetical protein
VFLEVSHGPLILISVLRSRGNTSDAMSSAVFWSLSSIAIRMRLQPVPTISASKFSASVLGVPVTKRLSTSSGVLPCDPARGGSC